MASLEDQIFNKASTKQLIRKGVIKREADTQQHINPTTVKKGVIKREKHSTTH
jgi:hypothetical protein